MIVNRNHYLDKIRPFIGKPVIKVLTGMRRVGKSTILRQLYDELIETGVPEENILIINKELLEWDHIRSFSDLDGEVKSRLSKRSGGRWIIIDEVQEIHEWEKAVRSFLAEGFGDIIITGSNAQLLSSELTTLLTGRYIEIPIYPLGFTEFLTFRAALGDSSDSTLKFHQYLRYGGLPGIHMLDLVDRQVYPYLDAILNTILLKDVVSRHNIRDVNNLGRILNFVFDNIGNLNSARNIAAFFRNQQISITPDTVIAYLGHLQQAFLIHRVDRYEIKGKKHLAYIHKYYSGDFGFRHALFGYRDNDIGGLLENCVFLELLRRGYSVRTGVLGDGEIDFVAEREDKRIYIQVAYLLPDEQTVEREFGRLEQIPDNYPKFVLSLDEYFPPERRGIKHCNIREFLLQDEIYLS